MRSARHPHDSDSSSDNASETLEEAENVVVLLNGGGDKEEEEERVFLHSSSASLQRHIDAIVIDDDDDEPEPAESVSERSDDEEETAQEEEEALFTAPPLFDTVPALSQFEHVGDAATRRWLQRRPLAPSRLVRHKAEYLAEAVQATLGVGHRPLSAAHRDFLRLYHAHPSVLCWRLSLAAVKHYGSDRIRKHVRASPLRADILQQDEVVRRAMQGQ